MRREGEFIARGRSIERPKRGVAVMVTKEEVAFRRIMTERRKGATERREDEVRMQEGGGVEGGIEKK